MANFQTTTLTVICFSLLCGKEAGIFMTFIVDLIQKESLHPKSTECNVPLGILSIRVCRITWLQRRDSRLLLQRARGAAGLAENTPPGQKVLRHPERVHWHDGGGTFRSGESLRCKHACSCCAIRARSNPEICFNTRMKSDSPWPCTYGRSWYVLRLHSVSDT